MLKSIHKGLESLSYLGPKMLDILQVDQKQTGSFKTKIKNWNPQCCTRRLCKVYLQHVHGILSLRKMGENFNGPWGTLNSNLPQGFLAKWEA